MAKLNIADIRQEYTKGGLRELYPPKGDHPHVQYC